MGVWLHTGSGLPVSQFLIRQGCMGLSCSRAAIPGLTSWTIRMSGGLAKLCVYDSTKHRVAVALHIIANIVLSYVQSIIKLNVLCFLSSLCPTEMVESLKNNRVLHCIDSEWGVCLTSQCDWELFTTNQKNLLHFGPFLEHSRYHFEQCWRLHMNSSSWNGSTDGKVF